jgi:hypothetical protein
MWSYLMTKRAALICQLSWRQSIARKQLVKLRLVLPALLFETSTAHSSSCVRCLTCERNNVQANLQRLHEMVDVLQQAVGDAEARAIAEREAAKKAIAEAPPVIKQTVVTVEDTEKVNSLHAEVARLKVCHSHQSHWSFESLQCALFL